jgi:hypothetical protein
MMVKYGNIVRTSITAIALMMEAVNPSETLANYQLHGAASQKTAIFAKNVFRK